MFILNHYFEIVHYHPPFENEQIIPANSTQKNQINRNVETDFNIRKNLNEGNKILVIVVCMNAIKRSLGKK